MKKTNEKLLLLLCLMLSSASMLVNSDQHSGVGTLLAAGLITLLLKGKHHGHSRKKSVHRNGFGYSHIPHILNIDNGFNLAYEYGIPYLIDGNNVFGNRFISDSISNSQVLTRKHYPLVEGLEIGLDSLGPEFGIHDLVIDGR